jgi:hypothetical protein
MFKTTYLNIVLFILLKYFIYYLVFNIFIYDGYDILHSFNIEGVIYLFIVFLPLPLISIILFSAPLYYAFRVNFFYFMLILLGVLLAEYYIFVLLTSQRHIDRYGVLNGAITVFLFLIGFYKSIPRLIKK